MKKLLLIVSALCIVQGIAAARNPQQEQNAVLVTEMVNALTKALQSKESIEWQQKVLKLVEEGIVITARQANPYLSQEGKELLKKILAVLRDNFQLMAKMCSELSVAPSCEREAQIRGKYAKKLEENRETLALARALFQDVSDADKKQVGRLLSIAAGLILSAAGRGLANAVPAIA